MDQVGFGQNEREDGQVDEIGAGARRRGIRGDLRPLLRRKRSSLSSSGVGTEDSVEGDVAAGNGDRHGEAGRKSSSRRCQWWMRAGRWERRCALSQSSRRGAGNCRAADRAGLRGIRMQNKWTLSGAGGWSATFLPLFLKSSYLSVRILRLRIDFLFNIPEK